MTTAVQHRRGTTAEHSTFTGLEGEVTIDTTKDTAVIHDGVLAGGYPLAKETLANVNPTALTAITGAATASDDLFMVYDASTTSMKKITRAELNNAMEADALANVSITGGTINGTTIGGTTAAAGSFTTLSASDAVTLSAGTANGVAYLNGSKVLTTGSALTFDGAKFGIGGTAIQKLSVFGTVSNFHLNPDSTGNVYSYAYNDAGAAYTALRWDAAYHAFLTSGTEAMRLTSTGLGIGTSSPAYKLDVAGATYARLTTTTYYNGGLINARTALSGGTYNTFDFVEGSTTTGYLRNYGSVYGGGLDNHLRLWNTQSAPITFGTNNTERARIDSSGVLLLSRTSQILGSNNFQIDAFGNGAIAIRDATSTGWFQRFYDSTSTQVGSITRSGSSTVYATSSDYRLKEDWQPMTGASERVKALKPVNFAWKVDGSRVDGFIAHEAAEVVPEAVTGTKDAVDADGNPEYQGIDQSKLVPLLTAALQEALAEIDSLKSRLTAAGL